MPKRRPRLSIAMSDGTFDAVVILAECSVFDVPGFAIHRGEDRRTLIVSHIASGRKLGAGSTVEEALEAARIKAGNPYALAAKIRELDTRFQIGF